MSCFENDETFLESSLKKTKRQREEEQLYSEVLAHYRNVKDAWRNHVSHARAIYDENQAMAIYSHVREFMRQLGTRLSENEYSKKKHAKAVKLVSAALIATRRLEDPFS